MLYLVGNHRCFLRDFSIFYQLLSTALDGQLMDGFLFLFIALTLFQQARKLLLVFDVKQDEEVSAAVRW